MGVRRGVNEHLRRLEIGTKNQKFPEKLKSEAQFRLTIDLILALAVYLPV